MFDVEKLPRPMYEVGDLVEWFYSTIGIETDDLFDVTCRGWIIRRSPLFSNPSRSDLFEGWAYDIVEINAEGIPVGEAWVLEESLSLLIELRRNPICFARLGKINTPQLLWLDTPPSNWRIIDAARPVSEFVVHSRHLWRMHQLRCRPWDIYHRPNMPLIEVLSMLPELDEKPEPIALHPTHVKKFIQLGICCMSQIQQLSDSQALQPILDRKRGYAIQSRLSKPENVAETSAFPALLDLGYEWMQQSTDLSEPSAVVVFPELEIERFSKTDLNALRKRLKSEPFPVPDSRYTRMPSSDGSGAVGWGAYYMDKDGDSEVQEIEGIVPYPLTLDRGWYLSDFLSDEIAINGRWKYLQDTDRAGHLLDAPIPHIQFRKTPDPRTREYLHYCLEQINPNWETADVDDRRRTVHYLFDWLLYGLGHPLMPKPPAELWDGYSFDRLYKVFKPAYLLVWPYDYFGMLLEEAEEGLPTSPQFRQITMGKAEKEVKKLFPQDADYRVDMLVDPETSSGRILLHASNHTLELVGLSTNAPWAKATILNGYFYIPWLIHPLEWLQQEKYGPEELQDCLGRTLSILQAKGISSDYLEAYEEDPELKSFLPVQILRRKPPAELELQDIVLPGNVEFAVEGKAMEGSADNPTLIGGVMIPEEFLLDASTVQIPQLPAVQSIEIPGGVAFARPKDTAGTLPGGVAFNPRRLEVEAPFVRRMDEPDLGNLEIGGVQFTEGNAALGGVTIPANMLEDKPPKKVKSAETPFEGMIIEANCREVKDE